MTRISDTTQADSTFVDVENKSTQIDGLSASPKDDPPQARIKTMGTGLERSEGRLSDIGGLNRSEREILEAEQAGVILTLKDVELGGTASPAEMIVPIMTREDIAKRLQMFERKYDLSSQEFYEQWKAGEAPHGIDTLRWVSLWEMYKGGYLLPLPR